MTAKHDTKTVNLALQGGGAHGAFTWGVLDRLLEEDRLRFEGVSGTSAGAMNAALLKTGLLEGGRDGARHHLSEFWGSIQKDAAGRTNPIYEMIALFSEDLAQIFRRFARLPARMLSEFFQRNVSPYEWNPLDVNPLRMLLNQVIDWDAVCANREPHIFVSATNVRTGQIRVFGDAELSVDSLLASACLPTLFRAVEIDGEEYWDGGYVGNPALFPLLSMESRDIVIVHIDPIERKTVPRQAQAILNRVNEISFNSSLMRELRALDTVRALIEVGRLVSTEHRDPLLHSIRSDEVMVDLPAGSKVAPHPTVIDRLHREGYSAAEAFLKQHWGALNAENSLDLQALLSRAGPKPLIRVS